LANQIILVFFFVYGHAVVTVTLQGGLFSFQCLDGPFLVFQLSRFARQVDLDPGTTGVQEIDGLVGQEPACDIFVGHLGGRLHGVIPDNNMMGFLIICLQTPKDQGGDFHVGLIQLNQLKSSGQSRILFKIFFIFGPGGGGHGAQFPSGQGRLEEIGGIAASGSPTGSDESMGFIDKQNDGLFR